MLNRLSQLGHAVFPSIVQFKGVGFLFHGKFWLFPSDSAVDLGGLYFFAGAHPNKVGFKLGNHRQHVEQQFAHGDGGVMDGTTDAEFDFAAGEVVGNFVGVPDGTGQTVKFGNDEGIPGPARGQGFVEASTILVGAGKPMINLDAFRLNAEDCQGITLCGEGLLFRGHAGIADHDLRHADQCAT